VCVCVCVWKKEFALPPMNRPQIVHTATHCNTLQHTATRCNKLQHFATYCNTLQHTATHRITLQHHHCNLAVISSYTYIHVYRHIHIHICIYTLDPSGVWVERSRWVEKHHVTDVVWKDVVRCIGRKTSCG